MLRAAFFIAKKELYAKKWKITLIIIAISTGVIAYVVTDALMKGWSEDIANKTINLYTAHVKIFPSKYMYIDNPGEIIQKIRNSNISSSIAGISTRVNTEALIYSNNISNTIFCRVIGIMPKNEISVTNIRKIIIKGTYLSDFDKCDAILGYRLANEMHLKVGDNFNLLFPNGIKVKFKVKGIFRSNYYEFDKLFVFIPIKTLQSIMNIGDKVSEILIRLNDINKADSIRLHVKNMLPNYVKALTWKDLMGYIYVMLTTEGTFAQLIIGLILLVAGLGLSGIMFLTVSSRIRYIGIMKALGARNKLIFTTYFLETLFIGFLSIIIGDFISFILVKYLERNPIPVPESVSAMYGTTLWPFKLTPYSFVYADIFVLILCILAGLYPAFKASKLDPVEAIRYVF